MKKIGILILLLLAITSLSACTSKTTGTADAGGKKEIRIGFNPGPYQDEFKKGIQPLLEKKGYKITSVEFSDGMQLNFALSKGEIDANIFQHSAYLKAFNAKNKLDNIGVVQIPTPPMGLYTKKHRSLSEIRVGQTVTLPSDPVNQSRALVMLKRAGWIKYKENVDPLTVSEKDITENPYNLKFVPLELAQLPRSLDDADFSLISGNYAYATGLRINQALLVENMTSPYINVVAVKPADKDKPFVKDIIDAYHSPEFRKVHDADQVFNYFTRPDYLK